MHKILRKSLANLQKKRYNTKTHFLRDFQGFRIFFLSPDLFLLTIKKKYDKNQTTFKNMSLENENTTFTQN